MPTARTDARPWNVLVAVDGSRGSAAALVFASHLASNKSARVIVMTVAALAPRRSERAHADRLLDDASERLRRAGVSSEKRVVTIRPTGSIPEAIRRESDRVRADLVVIGSEGRDTLREWVVGGVALRLLYLSRRPVVVVRPSRRRMTQCDHCDRVAKFSSHIPAPAGVYVTQQRPRKRGSRRGGGS